jgi:glycine cleavage system regulatory protein
MQGLNESHQNRILITLLDLRRQLEQVEDAMLRPAKLTPFFEHDNDLTLERTQAILHCFSRIRTALLQAAQKLELPVEVRRTSLSWELQCLLTHFQISLIEVGPKQLRGYGEVGKPAGEVLQQVQQELGQLVDELAVQVALLSQKT